MRDWRAESKLWLKTSWGKEKTNTSAPLLGCEASVNHSINSAQDKKMFAAVLQIITVQFSVTDKSYLYIGGADVLYFKIKLSGSHAMPTLTCRSRCLSAGPSVRFLLSFIRAAQHLSTSSSGCWKNTQAEETEISFKEFSQTEKNKIKKFCFERGKKI